jgi:iron complex outermembrane recepter protein
MRLKSVILSTTSAAVLAFGASPALAQDDPNTPPDDTVEAQESPNDPDAGSPQTDDAVASEEGETIVVTGLRRSLRSAQNIKRNSDQIVDAIVAEDIGKLPDVTVAETAARIPGIQVDRARGEAAGQVLLRGLPDLTTTYNGREIFTAETRSVALGDFPAGGIAAIEAFKSTTANLIEGGIAGLINVRSRRPFDFQDREVSGSFRYTYAKQSGKWDPNGNLLFSDRWDAGDGEMGALLNVSYTQLRYLDSARWNGGVIGNFTTTTGQNFVAPDAVGIFYGSGDRRRPSINGAFQWRPSPGLEFYVDGLWQGYRDRVADRQMDVRLWGGAQFSNLVLRNGNEAQSVRVQPGPPPFHFQGATFRATDTYQFAAGGSWDAGSVRLSADVAYTDSVFDMSLYSFDFEPNRAPAFNVNFDVPNGPGGVEFAFENFDTTNPANYNYLGFFDRAYEAGGDGWQFRTDLVWETGFDFLPEFEFGLRHTTRDAYQENAERYCATWMGNCGQFRGPTPLTAIPVELHLFRPGFRGAEIQQLRNWITPTYRSIRDNVENLRTIAGFASGPPPLARIFTANEKTYAAYAQVGYEFDLGGMPVDGRIGMRAVKTDFDVTTTTTSGNEFTDWLPNASMRLRFTDQLQLRLSATQTRTRPTFEQLRPIIFNSTPPCFGQTPLPPPESCFVTGGGGNPNLGSIKSNNYDASLEYYFRRNGYASLAVFRRDFTGFITNFDVRMDHPTLGANRALVNIPVNGGEGRIQGFEAAFQTFLDFLPSPFDGFGVQANLTHLDDEQEFPPAFNLTFDEPGRILGVSRWSYNLVGMYEKGPLTARLSYNKRSRWNTSYSANATGGFTGEYIAGTDRLDWSSSFTPFENVTFEFNVSNILGNPFRNFRRFTASGSVYPRDVRYEETIYSLGVRFRL